jgi:23S rRNA (cytidine1920-2'-O)/16S rRNA (cytidine1409-2'-O)-methyltransferase
MRRRLDAELVRRGLVGSRTRATEVIRAGRVHVGGAPTSTPARQVGADEPITVSEPAPRFASRGGDKLAAALERFAVDVGGRRVLDAGASTGGFTDCLLQSGAAHVYAVDVGKGQLAWTLRQDPRVTVLDRTNVRTLEPDALGGPVDVVTTDLSFISLVTVAPALVRCASADADFVLLVKPQFEAGRRQVGKGGIVRDPDVHTRVLHEVTTRLAAAGLASVAVMPSPRRGARGNIEFLLHARRGSTVALPGGAIAAAVAEAHAVAIPAADDNEDRT